MSMLHLAEYGCCREDLLQETGVAVSWGIKLVGGGGESGWRAADNAVLVAWGQAVLALEECATSIGIGWTGTDIDVNDTLRCTVLASTAGILVAEVLLEVWGVDDFALLKVLGGTSHGQWILICTGSSCLGGCSSAHVAVLSASSPFLGVG